MRILLTLCLFLFPLELLAAIDGQAINYKAVTIFLIFVVFTLYLSYLASRRTKTNSEFYTANGQISGFKNGIAISGDFMSAASFLGISGLMFIGGFDGLIFALGAFAGFPLMLFLFAEKVRNLGLFTIADVAASRLDARTTRLCITVTSIAIVLLYLIAQMVGIGKLVELLFGISYELALLIVGCLVVCYVAFGGMLATTWVQIVKAILLLFGSILLTFLILQSFGFSFSAMVMQASELHRFGDAYTQSGNLISDPIQVLTILVSMALGTLGLPHILMRLFTVPNMVEAKKSVAWASAIMGFFFIILVVIGFGTAAFILNEPDMLVQGKLVGGNNMAAVILSQLVGGDWLLGFIAAVTFATILAVVAGLTVAGSAAISHDIYANIICKGKPKPEKEVWLIRLSTLALCTLAVLLGIVFQDQNIAFIATLPFVFAASINFPIIFMTLYWKEFTSKGALYGALFGFVMSLVSVILGPKVWVGILGNAVPIVKYDYPALFILPIVIVVMVIVSKLDRSERGVIDRKNYYKLLAKSELGQ